MTHPSRGGESGVTVGSHRLFLDAVTERPVDRRLRSCCFAVNSLSACSGRGVYCLFRLQYEAAYVLGDGILVDCPD